MGDNERCSALQHRIEARLQCFLGLHVDTRGCLIENQNRRIRKQRSRKRDQLFLALAQHGAALPHLGLIAVRHFADELIRADGFAHIDNLIQCRIEFSVTDVVLNVSRENKAVLHHNAHLLTQGMDRHLRDVLAVDQDTAAVDIIEPRDQIDNRTLSGSRRSDERHALARFYRERNVF